MEQVKIVEDSLQKIELRLWAVFKGGLPQISLGPFLSTNVSCWEIFMKIYYLHSQFLNLVLHPRKTLIKLLPLSILQHKLIFQLLVCYYHQLSCPLVQPGSLPQTLDMSWYQTEEVQKDLVEQLYHRSS